MQEVTLADLFHLPYGSLLGKLGFNYLEDPAKRPNVARYFAFLPMVVNRYTDDLTPDGGRTSLRDLLGRLSKMGLETLDIGK